MKILLIGEFSGVHNNLKIGLVNAGNHVFLASSDGDGYKGFKYDFKLSPKPIRHIGKFGNSIYRIIYFFLNINKIIGFDIVQFISPFSIPFYFYKYGFFNIMIKRNKKLIYYACGTDPYFLNAKNSFDYFPFDEMNSPEYPKYNKQSTQNFEYFLSQMDCIIPAMFTYYIAYLNHPKIAKPIPLPGENKYNLKVKTSQNKIVIMHGISRKDFKGSSYILSALNRIEKNYPELVQINVVERLSINEYKDVLNSVDISIDQCKTYDYGMNAILSMSNGHIVFSGARKEALEYLGIKDCPVICIKPDANDIYNKLEKLILTPDKIMRLKKKSIEYVKRIHAPNKIADQFNRQYQKLLS